MSFSVDVSKWVKEAELSFDETVRGTAIKLFSGIIKSSPVDEGTFRNNWFVSGLTPSSEVNPDDNGGSDSGVISEMTRDVLALRNFQAITFTNNLPYSEVIEYGGYPNPAQSGTKTSGGYSKQAPQGVVRVNAVRFQQLINEEAARVRNS